MFNINLILLLYFEHLLDVLNMLIQGASIDHYIAELQDHKHVKRILQNLTHQCAKDCQDIGKSKGHQNEFRRVIMCSARLLNNANLPII